jgi:hypothetical protein
MKRKEAGDADPERAPYTRNTTADERRADAERRGAHPEHVGYYGAGGVGPTGLPYPYPQPPSAADGGVDAGTLHWDAAHGAYAAAATAGGHDAAAAGSGGDAGASGGASGGDSGGGGGGGGDGGTL